MMSRCRDFIGIWGTKIACSDRDGVTTRSWRRWFIEKMHSIQLCPFFNQFVNLNRRPKLKVTTLRNTSTQRPKWNYNFGRAANKSFIFYNKKGLALAAAELYYFRVILEACSPNVLHFMWSRERVCLMPYFFFGRRKERRCEAKDTARR